MAGCSVTVIARLCERLFQLVFVKADVTRPAPCRKHGRVGCMRRVQNIGRVVDERACVIGGWGRVFGGPERVACDLDEGFFGKMAARAIDDACLLHTKANAHMPDFKQAIGADQFAHRHLIGKRV